MAAEPETPDPQFGELRVVPDEPTERDIRLCCIRAAIDLNRPGETTVASIVAEAQHILGFINGSAQ